MGARHQQSLIIHGPEGGREPTRVTQHKPVESRTPVVQLNACYGLKQLQRCSNAQLVSARQSVAAGWVARAPYRTRGTDRSDRVRVSVRVARRNFYESQRKPKTTVLRAYSTFQAVRWHVSITHRRDASNIHSYFFSQPLAARLLVDSLLNLTS